MFFPAEIAYHNTEKREVKYKESVPSKRAVEQVVTGEEGFKYKYNGKELQDELGLNTYAYGWREYDPAIARFNRIDRFAEKYFNLTPYSYAGNNPVLFLDVQGDSIAKGKQMRRANRMQRRLNRRVRRLNRKINRRVAKGKNIGDMRERVLEMENSIQDIEDMKSDERYWYRFERTKGVPITYKTKENEITMFMPNFRNMHEPRHGGQIARGEYDIIGVGITGKPTTKYGAEDEISALRAEYASTSRLKLYGNLTYLPKFSLTQEETVKMAIGVIKMQDIYIKYKQHIRDINDINKDLLKNMYDTNGVKQIPIYRNRPSIWWNN